jgi:hypothetical protein
MMVNPNLPSVNTDVSDVEAAAGATGQQVSIARAESERDIEVAFANCRAAARSSIAGWPDTRRAGDKAVDAWLAACRLAVASKSAFGPLPLPNHA